MKSGNRQERIQIAKGFDMGRQQTDFFMGFAHRSGNRIDIDFFDATTRETDLPGMVPQCFGTPGQNDMQTRIPFDQTDQDGSRSDRRTVFRYQIDQFVVIPGRMCGSSRNSVQRTWNGFEKLLRINHGSRALGLAAG